VLPSGPSWPVLGRTLPLSLQLSLASKRVMQHCLISGLLCVAQSKQVTFQTLDFSRAEVKGWTEITHLSSAEIAISNG
jgi:hypothetical protein